MVDGWTFLGSQIWRKLAKERILAINIKMDIYDRAEQVLREFQRRNGSGSDFLVKFPREILGDNLIKKSKVA